MAVERVELFVGQMIALLPKIARGDADPVQQRQLLLLFPHTSGDTITAAGGRGRPRTYSLITNGHGGGDLAAGGTEIPVAILPLDVTTPREATAFRIVAIAGRALRVRGTAQGDLHG